jgi:cytochrome bd ubiquinol oxidase subunit II
MTDELIAISILWIFVFIYAIAAAIDFGAGFWSWIFLWQRQTYATHIANRYLSPSWEVTNVHIVLIVVGLVSFFPGATGVLGHVLLMPFSVGLLLLTIRSAFLVYSHAADKYHNQLIVISGITGIFIPLLLILVLPITYGESIGILDPNTNGLRLMPLFATGSAYAYMAFAVTSTLFLSALLLADYSQVSLDNKAYGAYRRRAIYLGPISLLASVSVIASMSHDAPWMYDNLIQNRLWIIGSIAFFAIGYAALQFPQKLGLIKGRPRIAVICVVIQYLLAATAYGMAHLPYLVYPTVTLQSSFTSESTFHALFASYIVGFIVLTPGFYIFWRLFMQDDKYLREKSK